MISDLEKLTSLEVTLRMTSSVRRDAEFFSKKEGISLDAFVEAAIVEKLAYLQQEWVRKRRPMTEARRARATAILDRAGSDEVEAGDELPEGYVSPIPRSTP